MEEALARSGLFQGVDSGAADDLAKEMEMIEIRKGEVLFNEGEPGDSLYIVLSGRIKVGRRAADGRQNLIALMGPSDMVGELSLFDPGPRTATATAVVDSRLARLRKHALRPWLTNRPEIAEQLLRVLARRLRRTNNTVADLIFTDVPGRVAKNLLQMASQFGSRDGGVLRVTHDLTQEEMAQLVGASRETVNKALADFVAVQERSRVTQQRLLEATIDCLVEYGWSGATTTVIAERAGVSRGAQLHHYPTRAALVMAAVEHLAERRAAEIRAEAAALGAGHLDKVVDMLAAAYTGPLFVAALELWVAGRTDPELRDALVALEARVGREMHRLTVDLLSADETKPGVREVVQAILDLVRGLGVANLLTDDAHRRRAILHAWKRQLAAALGA